MPAMTSVMHQSPRHYPLEDFEKQALSEQQRRMDAASLSGGTPPGTALLLMCDCGARYLCEDQGQRKKIHGDKVRAACSELYQLQALGACMLS